MFRSRLRSETSSRPTARRGSVGSASVWDERTRAQRAASRGAPPKPREGAAPDPVPRPLPAEELAALVADIVQVALDARIEAPDPDRRAQLAHMLQIRLLALLAGAPPAPPTSEPGLEQMEPGADPPVATRPEEEPGVVFTPAEESLGRALEVRLARLGGALAERADLRGRLVALAFECAASAPESVEASREELRILDLLQRRAAKLEHSLHETRAALDHVSGLEHVDTGIASIYRTVQGLSSDDPLRDRKRASLESLFLSNLALQKADRARRADDE